MANISRFIMPPFGVDSNSSTHADGDGPTAREEEAQQLRGLWYRFRLCHLQRVVSLWRGALRLSPGLQSAWGGGGRRAWRERERVAAALTGLYQGEGGGRGAQYRKRDRKA